MARVSRETTKVLRVAVVGASVIQLVEVPSGATYGPLDRDGDDQRGGPPARASVSRETLGSGAMFWSSSVPICAPGVSTDSIRGWEGCWRAFPVKRVLARDLNGLDQRVSSCACGCLT